MSETDQEREGRVLTECVLQQVINETEHEITQLYTIVFKELRKIHERRLNHRLKDAKDALEWAKGRAI